MKKIFELIFDEFILKQLKKASKDNKTKEVLTNMFDKLEEKGPDSGTL